VHAAGRERNCWIPKNYDGGAFNRRFLLALYQIIAHRRRERLPIPLQAALFGFSARDHSVSRSRISHNLLPIRPPRRFCKLDPADARNQLELVDRLFPRKTGHVLHVFSCSPPTAGVFHLAARLPSVSS
jgi:hypothetical protein